jgi:putative two-component system response regulator
MPHDEAIAIILEGRGSHFDPDIVDAFAAITEQFRDIASRYAD